MKSRIQDCPGFSYMGRDVQKAPGLLTSGTLRSNDADGSKNVKKKTIGLISKTTTLHVHYAFLYISLPALHDYDVKMPNFAF